MLMLLDIENKLEWYKDIIQNLESMYFQNGATKYIKTFLHLDMSIALFLRERRYLLYCRKNSYSKITM